MASEHLVSIAHLALKRVDNAKEGMNIKFRYFIFLINVSIAF